MCVCVCVCVCMLIARKTYRFRETVSMFIIKKINDRFRLTLIKLLTPGNLKGECNEKKLRKRKNTKRGGSSRDELSRDSPRRRRGKTNTILPYLN